MKVSNVKIQNRQKNEKWPKEALQAQNSVQRRMTRDAWRCVVWAWLRRGQLNLMTRKHVGPDQFPCPVQIEQQACPMGN